MDGSTGSDIWGRQTIFTSIPLPAIQEMTVLVELFLRRLRRPITQFDPVVFGPQYQVPISTGGILTSGTSQSALLLNRPYEVSDTVSSIRGRHALKAGARVIAVHTGGNSKEFGGPIYQGQFIYNTCTQSLAFCESHVYLGDIANVRTYTQSYGAAFYLVNDVLWSLFAQDDFRIRPDLTLNLGLRYERQTFTDSTRDLRPGWASPTIGSAAARPFSAASVFTTRK